MWPIVFLLLDRLFLQKRQNRRQLTSGIINVILYSNKVKHDVWTMEISACKYSIHHIQTFSAFDNILVSLQLQSLLKHVPFFMKCVKYFIYIYHIFGNRENSVSSILTCTLQAGLLLQREIQLTW